MQRLTRWFLLLALVALIMWIWRSGSEEVGPAGEGIELPGPALEDPVRFVFSEEGDSIVVERTDGGYWVTHPVRDLANEFRIRQTIRGYQTLEPARILAEVDPVRYGLAPSQRAFSIENAEGARWTLALGDSSAVGAEVYARVERPGAPVVLLDRFSARRDFYPELKELRDPVPLPLPRPVVDSIEVITRDWYLRAYRESRDRWVARQPDGLVLSPLHINRCIRHLRLGSIRDYPPPGRIDLGRVGLDPPRATWIVYQDGNADTVRIGHPIETGEVVWCIPARRDIVVTMTGDYYRDFVDGWPALAELALFTLELEDIEAVRFLEGGRGGAYVRGETGWQREPGDTLVRAIGAFERDLTNLVDLQWGRYPVEPVRPSPEPELVLELATEARAETLWMAPGEVDTLAYARSSERPQWSTISPIFWRIWTVRSQRIDL